MRHLFVVGAGGFGRETLDVVDAINSSRDSPVFELVGVLDDSPSDVNVARLTDRSVAHLGPISRAAEYANFHFVVAIGTPSIRRVITDKMLKFGGKPVALIHPSVSIGARTAVGLGSIVCAGVQISTNVDVGCHVHLNPNSTVGHDTVLGDYVSVNPAAVVSGDCTVRDGVLIGAGAVVLQGIEVGLNSVVGAAACVVRDVNAGTVVKGVPAQ